jgi:hypothetical protein
MGMMKARHHLTFMISAKETELVSMLLTPASKLGTGRISNSP